MRSARRAPKLCGRPLNRTKVLLVGLYDTNTAALAPEILRSFAESSPIAAAFEITTLNLSIFSGSLDELAAAIESQHASVVGFSTYIWNYALVRQLVRRVSGTLVLGGPMCNGLGPEFLVENPDVDLVVTGEGEETFVELLEYIAGWRSLDSVRGVVTAALTTPPRPVLAELDRVPSPYARIFAEHPGLEWIAYETSRGCPYLCGFCTWGYAKRMRYHGLSRVLADLDLLLAQPSLRRIYLCDSSLLLDKPRAKAILAHLIDRRPDVALRYEFNAEQLDDEIVSLLVRLPESELNFGVQTITPRALKVMRRPFHRAKFERNFHALAARRGQSALTMDVIYGLPGDDLGGFRETLEYVLGFRELQWILTNPLILLPGSDFFRDRARHGIVLRDEESYVVESTATFPRDQMLAARRLSFWVSVVMFNARLREGVRREAEARGVRQVDVVERWFDSLPFSLVDDAEYPYLVPSVARDFSARNRAVFRVVALYGALVRCFDEWTAGAHAELLAGFEAGFVPQYHRLRRFALDEAQRTGLSGPCGAATSTAAE